MPIDRPSLAISSSFFLCGFSQFASSSDIRYFIIVVRLVSFFFFRFALQNSCVVVLDFFYSILTSALKFMPNFVILFDDNFSVDAGKPAMKSNQGLDSTRPTFHV